MSEKAKPQLEDFQDELIELLASGRSPGQIMELLQTDPRFEDYREYTAQFDPDMVAVACELIGVWARRKPE